MDITERENIVEIGLAVCCSDCFFSHYLALSLKRAIKLGKLFIFIVEHVLDEPPNSHHEKQIKSIDKTVIPSLAISQ